MRLQDISSEQNLRSWLTEQVSAWNAANANRVGLEWIEPTFGSSMGISDCSISYKKNTIGVELKHLLTRKEGICYKIRPVQRRYNVMGVKAGKKLLILATVVSANKIELVAIRGDKTPLRDYCSMLGSGCENGIIQTVMPLENSFAFFLQTIDDDNWWR